MEGVHWRMDGVMWGEGQMGWCGDAWLHAHVLGHGGGYWMAGRVGGDAQGMECGAIGWSGSMDGLGVMA